MADELQISINGQFSPQTGGANIFATGKKFGYSQKNESVTGRKYSSGSRDLTTTAEALPLGEVVNPRRMWVSNGGANPVEVSCDGGTTWMIEIAAGSQGYFGFPAGVTDVRMKSISGNSNDVEFFILDT